MSAETKIYEEKMIKTIEHVKADFASVRAGRANAGVLDRIMVEYYGTPTPLNQVAAISSPDPRTLTIQPWDATLMRAIEKAIQTSDLGINPQNDGRVIRPRRTCGPAWSAPCGAPQSAGGKPDGSHGRRSGG